ncbi:MAG: type II secretion system protein [Deltaproteobacteria bacterium]|nr:type II secretion system protein [Deltaproteobacteria bacterium]
MGRACSLSDNGGFTYLTALFMITVMGIALASAGQVWSTAAKREKEAELLFKGDQIRKAIGGYYEESPGAKTYPRTLEDLINDKRWPVVKKHLRKLYTDPMTGKADWELIKAADGGIMGVKSRSARHAYKRKGFSQALQGLEGKTKYSEWAFIYVPVAAPAARPAEKK